MNLFFLALIFLDYVFTYSFFFYSSVLTQNKHLAVTDITNKEQIIGTVIQEYLAVAIRIAVIKKFLEVIEK